MRNHGHDVAQPLEYPQVQEKSVSANGHNGYEDDQMVKRLTTIIILQSQIDIANYKEYCINPILEAFKVLFGFALELFAFVDRCEDQWEDLEQKINFTVIERFFLLVVIVYVYHHKDYVDYLKDKPSKNRILAITIPMMCRKVDDRPGLEHCILLRLQESFNQVFIFGRERREVIQSILYLVERLQLILILILVTHHVSFLLHGF